MVNKMFFLTSFLLGILFFQGKNRLSEEPRTMFFCDINPPTGIQVANITTNSVTVNWLPNSNTSNYTLRYRKTGSAAWTTATVMSGQNTYDIANLISCNTYEVQVASICTSQGIWSNSVVFSTGVNYDVSKSEDSSRIYISKVTVIPTGGVQMVSDSGPSNYSDYRNDTTRNIYLTPGSTGNQIIVNRAIGTGDLSFPRYKIICAWIDFNGDGMFEVTERIMDPSYLGSSTVGPSQSSYPFNVPADFREKNCGVTMRVLHCFWDYLSSSGIYSYGETEDYRVYPATGSLSTHEINNPEKISIYPNPASDFLNIQGLSSDSALYEIYSATGQKAEEGKVSGNTVNISKLIKGVYFLQLKTKDQAVRLKFIKK